MIDEKKISGAVIDKVEAALEERAARSDRRVFDVDLPSELERRSGSDRRAHSEQGK
ncbi:MAG: hypothetical protein ACJA0M_001357 [Chitinophagales bacterium]|jgi:hypothetical protein|tara:strand:- start:2075 stop:2242 length:168 start_codon:yes stop_codon:yes gene_type:complete